MSAQMNRRNSAHIQAAYGPRGGAFTLIELLLSLVIVTILSAAVYTVLTGALNTSRYLNSASATNAEVDLAVARMLHNLRMCSALTNASTQYGFDNTSLADEAWTTNSIPNWTATGFSGGAYGVFNPQNAQVTNSTGSTLPGTATGTNYAYLEGTGYIAPTTAPVASVAAAGIAYTLTVAAGWRNDMSQPSGSISITVGGTVVATTSSINLTQGTFVDTTLTYTTVAGDVGKPLSLELACSSASTQIGYNNVRLYNSAGASTITVVTQPDPNNGNATYTVTYALSGTNLTETDTRYGTNVICSNVSTFNVQLLSTNVVQITLTDGSSSIGSVTRTFKVYCRNL